MLRFLGMLGFIYVGLVLQSGVIADVPEPGRPFLPAILLIVAAGAFDPLVAMLLAGIIGFLLDGLSTDKLGIQLTVTVLLGFGLQLVFPLWRSKGLLALSAMTMLTCLIWRLATPYVYATLAGQSLDPHAVMTRAIQEAVGTAVVGALLILIWRGTIGHRPRRRESVRAVKTAWQMATR